VTISDLQNRWTAVVFNFEPDKDTDRISWDRRFADGTLAPSGEYRVVAVACDIHDLCGSDTGIIAIPFAAMSTVTQTPSPTATRTMTPQVTFTVTPTQVTPTQVLVAPTPGISPKPNQPTRSIPFWQLLGLLGLFLVIASASVIDPRPAAIARLRENINLILSRNSEDSTNNIE
jgi:hypothetical protein